MLELNRTQQITDLIHGTIQYSGLESAVISTPTFNRLHRILQSSMVYLTYSSNKVKRFEHSIGTMYLAGQILYNSVANTCNAAVVNGFISELEQEIQLWYENVDFTTDKLLNDELSDIYAQSPSGKKTILDAPLPDSTFYRENTPGNITARQRFAYLVAFQSIRLVGLLHDLGHLPYSHVLEHAIKTLYAQVSALDASDCISTDAQRDFLKIIKPYQDSRNELHEEIGKNLVLQIRAGIAAKLPKRTDESRLFLALVFDFTSKILSSDVTDNNIFSDLHSIVSGTVDADRLDYCSRDLYCSGMRKDCIPYQRILMTYRLVQKRLNFDDAASKRQHYLFCPATKALPEIEDLLDRRWKIFSQINYHHRVHKHEILFSEVLAQIGFDELKEENSLPKITTDEPSLPLQVGSIWVLISKLQRKNTLIDYLVIQLDDSWMDTLLKDSFFKKYRSSYRDMGKHGSEPAWNRFDELISTTKRYMSCFKRTADFREFDKQFCAAWSQIAHPEELPQGSVERIASDYVSTQNNAYQANTEKPTFAFNYLADTVYSEPDKDKLFRQIEEQLNSYLKTTEGNALKTCDCLVRSCRFGLGYNPATSPVYLWTGEETALNLEQLSVQHEVFKRYRELSPSFHLYYLPAFDRENDKVMQANVTGLLEKTAKFSAQTIWDKISRNCNKTTGETT